MNKNIALQIDKDYKLIKALAIDLKQRFSDTQGFSRVNLHNMKKFAHSFPDNQIVQTLSALLSVCRAWLITWSWKSPPPNLMEMKGQ